MEKKPLKPNKKCHVSKRGDVNDQTWEDELKQLKKQIAQLEAKLARSVVKPQNAIPKAVEAPDSEQICLNCKEVGHLFKDCQAPRSCFYCGGTDHTIQDCMLRVLCEKCG